MTNKNVFKGNPHVGNPHDGLMREQTLQDILRRSTWLNISMCALAGLTNCANADNVSAQEHFDAAGNMRSIVVNNPTAQIGTVKTPWMFVRPDGRSGFANNFTTNALSVVSENGIDYYAHVEGENGDRTKVIKFTIDGNTGIPSTHGDIIDTTTLGEEGSATKMENRKLVGVARGTLCFYPTEEYGTSLIYNPQLNKVFSDEVVDIFAVPGSVTRKCLASYQNENTLYVLCNIKYKDFEGETQTITRLRKINMDKISSEMDFYPTFSDANRVMAYRDPRQCFTGDSDGNVTINDKIADAVEFPGAISSITISPNGVDIFVTSTATNAFYNIGFENRDEEQYNVVSKNGELYDDGKPMVPKTTDGLVRIIDNRHNIGGKLLCVTTKGIHAIDD